MSRLDKPQEQIAYLKFWLGVMVVTDISLVGWLVSNAGDAAAHRIPGALAALVVITASGLGSARVLATRSKLLGTAFVADGGSRPPMSKLNLPIIKELKASRLLLHAGDLP